VTIEELKLQKRWVLHKDKVPYQPCGKKAMPNNPRTWSTYAECMAVVQGFSGVGLTLGQGVFGVDFDACCDAATGKFSSESREIVIQLDSYGEYSPSGTGCHVLGLGKLPGPGIKKTFPGCKAIEVKADGFYFTFTGRHLSKTPHDLLDRQAQITALYTRLARSSAQGLSVTLPQDEEVRFQKLWGGDKSDFDDDDSRADFALCQILARRFNNDPFKIYDEVCKSGCYREKWERADYRAHTILRAINHSMPVVETEWEVNDGGETTFLLDVEGSKFGHIPLGEISIIGGASGVGKSTLLMPLLEGVRSGGDVLGHKTKQYDYRLVLHDRSKRSVIRMVDRLHLPAEVLERIVRLTPEQQRCQCAEVVEEIIESAEGIELLAIEALDFWIPELNRLDKVSAVLDSLQRVAIRRNVAILATVGTPKQKAKDHYQLARDSLIGSSAIGRKVETVALLEFHNPEDPNSVRRCTLLSRDVPGETFYFEVQSRGLVLTTEPEMHKEPSALDHMEARVWATVKPGDEVRYQPSFGRRTTFYEWKRRAQDEGKVSKVENRFYRLADGVS
jgi:hypothetical protein